MTEASTDVVLPGRRLGRGPARRDPDDLKLARYAPKLLTPPTRCRLSPAVTTWPMYGNDELGDCVCADEGHAVQVVTALGQLKRVDVADADVLRTYEDVGGYRPGHPETDNGCVMGSMMDYLRRTGIGGHRIDGYASVDVHNSIELRQAIAFFGGVHLGLELPLSAQSQVGRTWKASSSHALGQPGSWGGHDVLVVDYDRTSFTCVTWGALQRMTPAFLAKYADEAFVTLWPEWIGANGRSPQGIGMDDLRSDLKEFS